MSIIRGTDKQNVVYSYLVITKEESIDIYKLWMNLKMLWLAKEARHKSTLVKFHLYKTLEPIYSERNQNSTHLWVWITTINVLSINPPPKKTTSKRSISCLEIQNFWYNSVEAKHKILKILVKKKVIHFSIRKNYRK